MVYRTIEEWSAIPTEELIRRLEELMPRVQDGDEAAWQEAWRIEDELTVRRAHIQ